MAVCVVSTGAMFKGMSVCAANVVVCLSAGRGSSQMGGGNQQDDGWTAVGRMSRNIDPSRMKITKVCFVYFVTCL